MLPISLAFDLIPRLPSMHTMLKSKGMSLLEIAQEIAGSHALDETLVSSHPLGDACFVIPTLNYLKLRFLLSMQ